MPYIKQHKREPFKADIEKWSCLLKCGGDLNYIFTKLCKEFIKNNGESYASYAECLSALEGAKLELYRRYVAPYEDKKIIENGDV